MAFWSHCSWDAKLQRFPIRVRFEDIHPCSLCRDHDALLVPVVSAPVPVAGALADAVGLVVKSQSCSGCRLADAPST